MTPPENSPLAAAAEISAFLDGEGIPYVIIGGLAVQYWGEPRTTRDVDVIVLLAEDYADEFLVLAVQRFTPRIADAVNFAKQNRVLLLTAGNSVPIDLSLGIPGYEEEVIRRAITVQWPENRPLRIISCEDLLIHKCVAGRPRDIEDVESILLRRGNAVDLHYVRRWLEEFSMLIPEHDSASRFEDVLTKVGEQEQKGGATA